MKRFAYLVAAIAAFLAIWSSYQGRVNASEEPLWEGAKGLPLSGMTATSAQTGETTMRIQIRSSDESVVYILNKSRASRELYAQLPMEISVDKYGGNEIIFYPPNKLSTADTPLLESASAGTLAYYAPWGDVVMFYGSFGSAAGLYELGIAISGKESIKDLSGTVRIDKYPD